LADEKNAVARLWAMAHLGTPMAIRVAATLRIADHIAAGRQTAAELAEAAHADADALARLLRYLGKRGLLRKDKAGRYTLTPVGEVLRDEHPAGMREDLDIEGGGRAELSFFQLLHSVRTGEAGYPVQFGHSFWDDLSSDTERGSAFDTRMSADAEERANAIIAGYDWGSTGHVVDVGGGNGSLMIGLLRAHPTLRGTVVDRAPVAEAALGALAAAGLAGRGDVAPGSFFDPLPVGAGAYLLSLVVHNWNDRDAGTLLRRCAEAAGPDGGVFVVENLGPDGESPASGMDLRMLVQCGGKERGLTELGKLAAEAGLRIAGTHPAGALSIVELRA